MRNEEISIRDTMAAAIGLKRKLSPTQDDESIKKVRIGDYLAQDDTSPDGTTDGGRDSDSESTVRDERLASESTAATSTTAGESSLKHPRRPKNYICDFPDCGKAYTRPVRLTEHQRSHTNERPFVCAHDGCTKAFLRDSHLKHHVKSAHENKRDWVCDWPGCGKPFVTGQRYRKHKEAHEEKEQCKCTGFPPCEQYFRKQETLQRHIVSVHMQDKPYMCDHVDEGTGTVCGRKFKGSNSLMSHREKEHSGDRFWCNLCRADKLALDPAIPPEESDAVGFATHGELQLHIKIVHPPTCSECGQVCSSKAQLRAHIDIQHGNPEERRKFFCDYPDCGRGFTRNGNLKVHIRSVHQKQKRFVCGQYELSTSNIVPAWDGRGACGRAMGSKLALENHVRTQHLHLPGVTGKNTSKGSQALGEEDKDDHEWQECSADAREQALQWSSAADMLQQSTTGLLTGAGYEESRALACTIVPCPNRFVRAYDLEVHLEACHGFTSLAAMEAALEQEALSGGQFWIGGSEEAGQDALLARKLNRALHDEDQY